MLAKYVLSAARETQILFAFDLNFSTGESPEGTFAACLLLNAEFAIYRLGKTTFLHNYWHTQKVKQRQSRKLGVRKVEGRSF